MSEEKRYKLKYIENDLFIEEGDDALWYIGDKDIPINLQGIVNHLNTLYDENQRLKTEFCYDIIKCYNLDEKLNFIVNLLFDINCYVDVHYNELLGMKLGQAERAGFNIEPSKDWDYDESSYEFWRNNDDD